MNRTRDTASTENNGAGRPGSRGPFVEVELPGLDEAAASLRPPCQPYPLVHATHTAQDLARAEGPGKVTP